MKTSPTILLALGFALSLALGTACGSDSTADSQVPGSDASASGGGAGSGGGKAGAGGGSGSVSGGAGGTAGAAGASGSAQGGNGGSGGSTLDAAADSSDAGARDGGDAAADVVTADTGAIDAPREASDAAIADTGSDAAIADTGSEAQAACAGDLSNVGTGDFSISFSFATTATQYSALLNQRATCIRTVFWDVRLAPASYIVVEVDDGANYSIVYGAGVFNDGATHNVRITRVSGVLSIAIDGAPIADAGSVPSTANLSALPALKTGTDVCVGGDTTVAFVGTISNVCVNH